jgi:hypothetical protein
MIMRRLILVLVPLVLLCCLFHVARADGSGSGSGSALVSAGSGSITTGTLHDPIAAPLQSLGDVESAWKIGWPFGVLVAMFLLVEAAAAAGKKWPSFGVLAALGKGRLSVVIAGATAVLAAMINAFGSGGWGAVIGAAVVAVAAIWHPAGTDPAKA